MIISAFSFVDNADTHTHTNEYQLAFNRIVDGALVWSCSFPQCPMG